MKIVNKIVIATVILLIFSCEENEIKNQTDSSDTISAELIGTFEDFQDINEQMSDLGNLNSELSQGNTGKNYNSCSEIRFNQSVEASSTIGFDDYTQFNELLVDYSATDCEPSNWSGSLEYYLAINGPNTLKDSLVLNTMSFGNGYSYKGFRVSEEDTARSNDQEQAFFITIDLDITAPDGTLYKYRADQDVSFTDRFSSSEQIQIVETVVLKDDDDSFFIKATSDGSAPLLFDAICFQGFDFLRYPVGGTHRFESDIVAPFSVDYGNGDCDKQVTIIDNEGNEQNYSFN